MQPCRPRNLERCNELAHEAELPFTCKGCKVTFKTKADVTNAKPKNENQRRLWQLNHEGQRPHAAPLLPITPYHMVPCVLHVMLRMVDGLFMHTVRLHIKTEEREARMNDVLTSMGIHVKKVKKTKADIERKAMKETKFHGRDCKKMLVQAERAGNEIDGYKAIIEAMEYAKEGDMTKEIALELWGALADLINELSDEWDEPQDIYNTSKQDDRDMHADKAKQLAEQYLSLFVRHIGRDTVTLYLHVCAIHIPAFIRRCGSLTKWSMQALEHCHSLRKKSWRVSCNRKQIGTKAKKNRHGAHGVVTVGYQATELQKQHSLQTSNVDVPERPQKTQRKL